MRHIYTVWVAIGRSFGQGIVRNVGRGWEAVRSWVMGLGRMMGVLLALGFALAGCGDRLDTSFTSIPLDTPSQTTALTASSPAAIAEVSPPSLLQKLRSRFDRYRPQVSIISPALDTVIESNTVTVNLNVAGLPLFRDERFGLGPHLQLVLDDQPAQLIFDINEPIVLTDLAPGTHTLRAFAVRPWSESFKNEGAFAQTTFHVYTKTGKNSPNLARPLLTYNQPSGTYGAEPILLDFYLTNAPLHAIAQEFEDDTIHDWRVRVTVNGQSFMLDRWEPIYLKGVKSGQNWLQLELIDELGTPIENAFNSTVRLFEYDPMLNDGLTELVNGSVTLNDALSVVGIKPPIEPVIEATEDNGTQPESSVEASPTPDLLAPDANSVLNPASNPELPQESDVLPSLEADEQPEAGDVIDTAIEPESSSESAGELPSESSSKLETSGIEIKDEQNHELNRELTTTIPTIPTSDPLLAPMPDLAPVESSELNAINSRELDTPEHDYSATEGATSGEASPIELNELNETTSIAPDSTPLRPPLLTNPQPAASEISPEFDSELTSESSPSLNSELNLESEEVVPKVAEPDPIDSAAIKPEPPEDDGN